MAFWIPGRPWPAPALKNDVFQKDFHLKIKAFWIPDTPDQPRLSNLILFKGIQLKIKVFWISGRPWPAPALKINIFQKDFN